MYIYKTTFSAIKYWRPNNADEFGTINLPDRVTGKLWVQQSTTAW